MKKTTIAILLIAIAAWAYPIHAASAKPNEEQAIFINYQKFHKAKTIESPNKIVAEKPSSPKTRQPKKNSSSAGSRRDYPAPTADKEAVKALIIKYSQQYGIDSAVPLCIAYYESGYNPSSKNKTSSASGVFQYLTGTWKGTDEGRAGLSVFDADSNVKAAVKYMASRKSTQPWEVRSKCPRL